MIRNRLLSIALVCTSLSLPLGWQAATADEIRLHSGDTFEGRLLEETAEGYRFEVHVTPSIRETRVFPRADVAELRQQTEAEKALAQLEERMPPGNRLTLADYDDLLAQANAFLEEHGSSPQAASARQHLATITEERELAAEGAVKVAGEWHSAEDQRRNRYDFDAMVLAEELQEHLEQENYLGALRAFDILLTEYPRSSHMVDSIPVARQALQRLTPMIDRMILDNPARVERRERSKTGLPSDQAARVERAIAEEEATLAAQREAEEEAGIRWKTYHAMHLDTLEATRERITETEKLLETKDVAELRAEAERFAEGMELLHRARELMEQKRFTEALDRVQEAQDKGAPQENLTAMRAEIAAAREPAEAPAPPPPPPATSTVDDLDDLAGSPLRNVMRDQHAEAEAARAEAQAAADAAAAEAEAAALAEEQQRREQAMAAADEADDSPAPDTGIAEADPAPPVDQPDEPEDAATAATDGSPEPAPAPPPAPAVDPSPESVADADGEADPAAAEEDSGFASALNLVILGLAGLMVVLIVVMKVTDIGSARRENARRERELAEREAAAKAEEEEAARLAAEEQAAKQTEVAAAAQSPQPLSLEELEAQAAEEADAEADAPLEQQPETHTAPIPQPSNRVSPPVPRP